MQRTKVFLHLIFNCIKIIDFKLYLIYEKATLITYFRIINP